MQPTLNKYYIELPTGEKLECTGFGATTENRTLLHGELVFQTGMIGYPEVITDPSFAGQFLVMTYPLIGNYPLPPPDESKGLDWSLESNRPALSCLIVSEVYNPENPDSEYLAQWLARHGVLGLANADTRYLTEYIRDHGDCMTKIYPVDTTGNLGSESAVIGNPVTKVSRTGVTRLECPSAYESTPRVLVWDFGIKHGQLDCLLKQGLNLDIYPYNMVPQHADISDILTVYSGIFLSNGPGDPRACVEVIEYLAKLIAAKVEIPVFGICLGHQILALAGGLQVRKLKYGHRGQNIPCRFIGSDGSYKWKESSLGFLTSQNHGYEVILPDPTPDNRCPTCYAMSKTEEYDELTEHICVNNGFRPLFVNANDGSNEGIVHCNLDLFSVQFHPEAKPGPRDTAILFEVFAERTRICLQAKTDPDIMGYTLNCHEYITSVLSCVRKPGVHNEWHLGGDNTVAMRSSLYDWKHRKSLPLTTGKVLIIGSGGLQIAQAGEFDYSGSQAIKSFKAAGLETILINPNIATIQTSMADRTYYVPLDVNFITQVIQTEKPDYITVSFGGQTALNAGIALQQAGILDKYNINLLGTPLENVHISEDRQLFKQTIENLTDDELTIACPPSISCASVDEALAAGEAIGYPILIRAGFCLGGAGSGFVNSASELTNAVNAAIIASGGNSSGILLDKSLRGWKELELEIMRDAYGNKLCICAMENVDPLGVHTGESIVVAPCQTLTDREFQDMRDIAFKIADCIGIVGECNVQFTINPNPVNPHKPEIYVIEMNARLSRSSALASKATGYPIAAIAAKLQLGHSLLDLPNPCTSTNNTAFFEPTLDYVVVKIPRWDLDKTPGVSAELGSAMKSVGEVMGIGRNFREALMKAIRMVGLPGSASLKPYARLGSLEDLAIATPDRILKIFSSIYNLLGELQIPDIVSEIAKQTCITPWFINQIAHVADICYRTAEGRELSREFLYEAKVSGLSDLQIAGFAGLSAADIATARLQHGINATPRHIDTVAGEFPCRTNYMYLSYEGLGSLTSVCKSSQARDAKSVSSNSKPGVIVLGSGVYRIGSSVEFDWCAVETSREARHLGFRSILINHNPETVSTDYDEADILYFEELSPEMVNEIWQHEIRSVGGCHGVIVGMGGQAANNIVMELNDLGVTILGTPAEMIDNAENRFKFSRMCDSIHVDQPKWSMVTSLQAAGDFCESVGYPVLVRPSYVLSGAGMAVIHTARDLAGYLANAKAISPVHPVVISQFITDAKEIEVDAVAQNGRIVIMAISEHVENAGVHSGDASLVLPAQDLTPATIDAIKEIAFKIAAQLQVSGPMNIQLIAKDDRLRVIECNLRASRSFPFASRTLNINFIRLATQVILQPSVDISATIPDKFTVEKVGVKVPMFSTARLTGAQVSLGVEMQSTGEVACFGPNRNIAYLKALMSTGMRLPPMLNARVLFISQAEQPVTMGYMRDMHWLVTCEIGGLDRCVDDIRASKYHMLFILNSTDNQEHAILARTAVDCRIPVCINTKQAKLIIESIYYYYHNAVRLDPWFDTYYPSSQSHTQLGINNHALSPAVVANSMQCVSYKPGIVIPLPRTQIVFTDKHILTAEQFNRNLLRQIFKRSNELKHTGCHNKPLTGKVIGLIFYTPSTRTRCSFESAIKRLGGETILVGSNESSVQKGESLYDTIKALDCYTDGLVIRAPNDTDLMTYRNVSKHSVINAGDLAEHPTQSLLDLFTIREERGSINGLRIAFVGDLLNGRTVHSLAKMLCCYDVDMYFVAPPEYMMPDDIIQYIQYAKSAHPNIRITWQSVTNYVEWLDQIAPIVDVVYMTRHQAERMPNPVSSGLHVFNLNREIMAQLNQSAMVLHPLPRNDEIPVELDTDPRCKYFRQMEYGLYVRMALAELVFSR